MLALLLALACTDKEVATDDSSVDTEVTVDDDDDDGVLAEDDCDDQDDEVAPGLDEVPYDGKDNDCDESTPDDDLDGDGYGIDEDCDDLDAAVNPGVTQDSCDGIDSDCDGEVGEDGEVTRYDDKDGDGWGDEATAEVACEHGDDWVDQAGDCDDLDAAVNPDAAESCNEIDDDCDDQVDEEVTSTFYLDADNDGFGDDGSTIEACEVPDGYSGLPDDCDDGDVQVNPDAAESCNGIDDDCDGTVDEPDATDVFEQWPDRDSDGYGDETAPGTPTCSLDSGYVDNDEDCDDTDATLNPETVWYIDYDGDGYGSDAYTLSQCDTPSGYVDNTGDCDDTNADVSPGGVEICNEIDDDCDGDVDDEDSDGPSSAVYYADDDGDGYGDADSTLEACDTPSGYVSDDSDCDDGDGGINPGASEICDGVDQDCDELVDESVLGSGADCPAESCAAVIADQPGATDGSYSLDPDGDGVAVDYECEMSTDGGGWTLVVAWDREFDGDSITDFEATMTELYNNMGRWEDKTDHIRWCDYDANSDVLAYEYSVDVPNDGEALTYVHYAGEDGMGDSGTFFFVDAGGSEQDILCSDNVTSGYYNSTELGYQPGYSCGTSDTNWEWNQTEQDDFGAEIEVFNLTSFHRDGTGQCGDNSRLYGFEFWVR